MNKNQLIQQLRLEAHIEGGYFRRTYQSKQSLSTPTGDRKLLSSIFYLLTDNRPMGHLHKNHADIIHYFHCGSAIRYTILHPNGQLETIILGHNLEQGQQLQLLVKGGCWKASELIEGEYGLISEAVCPEFHYEDRQLADLAMIKAQFPQYFPQLQHLILL